MKAKVTILLMQDMRVRQIQLDESELLKRLLTLHDQCPLEWDLGHQTSTEYLEDLFRKVQEGKERDGFWVLYWEEPCTPDSIVGILWARLKCNHDGLISCNISSIWIHPDLRNKNFTHLLTEPCLVWAKKNGATRIECATHINNTRMREILEKNNFQATMISYSLDLTKHLGANANANGLDL